jgi:DHA1 family bicyclomycin/chloramphenicol resistance-like MFS transporter
MSTSTPPGTTAARVGWPLVAVLCALAIFGPISMDLYLPVLPALTTDLGTTTSAAQLTITACLVGLALGQLLAGPLSDRFGRRVPLLSGLVAYVVVSVLCALSPSVGVLLGARLVQGLAGAVGLVIAQAAGRDLFTGGRLVRYYGQLTVLTGLAAILGPVIGGQLARVTDWRGTFVFLAAVGAVIFVAARALVRETLPVERRIGGGLGETARDVRRLLTDRTVVGAVLVTGLANAAVFAYLAGATFVLQDGYGLSPQGYSYAFALNSLGFMAFGWLAGVAAARWSERGTLVVGLVMVLAGAAGVLTTGILHLPLVAIVASLFTMVSGIAVTTPPTTSLALAGYPDMAGTASSLLGLARFGLGALTAPLVGLGGTAGDALPLGLVTTACAVLGVLAYVRFVRHRAAAPAPTRPEPARELVGAAH